MAHRIVRIEHADDARRLCELIGAPTDLTLRGWAVVRRDGKPGHVRGARGSASFAKGLHELSQLDDDVQRSVRNIDGTPPPLTLGGTTFDWSRPVVMGVVNVTPDSFSDGGRFLHPERAIDHGLRLVSEGADILDIGGESTRPRGKAYGTGAALVPDVDEIDRVVPVIRGLASRTSVPISIDTRKAPVAQAAIDAGAVLVNDVSGLLHDPSLVDVVRLSNAALVLMHTPRDIEQLTHEETSADVLGDVLDGLEAALRRARDIPSNRLLVDPGIGFGKTQTDNLSLLRHIASLRVFGHPVLVGASRKASIGRAAGATGAADERVGASIGAAVSAYLQGVHVIRAHDVKETVQALRVAKAIREAA